MKRTRSLISTAQAGDQIILRLDGHECIHGKEMRPMEFVAVATDEWAVSRGKVYRKFMVAKSVIHPGYSGCPCRPERWVTDGTTPEEYKIEQAQKASKR